MNTRVRKSLLIIGLLAAVVLVSSLAVVRQAYDAVQILADLGGVNLPIPDSRPEVARHAVVYVSSNGPREADIYSTPTPPRGGLVLVPGAAEAGRNDSRLVEFATLLSRSGFAVVVPDIESFRALRPGPASAVEIADAFEYLRSREDLGVAGHIGISAFSIATGPAVIAALDESVRGDLGFLLLVGGYYDLEQTLGYLTTGYFEEAGEWQFRAPNAYGKWVYALTNAQRLQVPSDQQALSALALRKLDNETAPIDDLLDQLGPQGLAVYRFISNSDPNQVQALLEALPSAVHADIAALNLATYDLSTVRADVLVIHGRDDDIIPYGQSEALVRALPTGRAELYLLDGLHHVDRDFHGADLWKMWQVMYHLMGQRASR